MFHILKIEKKEKLSTSVAKAEFNDLELNFQNIFRAEPPINSGYHFGSRLVIKDDFIYITAGERGEGMIAQDPKNILGVLFEFI